MDTKERPRGDHVKKTIHQHTVIREVPEREEQKPCPSPSYSSGELNGRASKLREKAVAYDRAAGELRNADYTQGRADRDARIAAGQRAKEEAAVERAMDVSGEIEFVHDPTAPTDVRVANERAFSQSLGTRSDAAHQASIAAQNAGQAEKRADLWEARRQRHMAQAAHLVGPDDWYEMGSGPDSSCAVAHAFFLRLRQGVPGDPALAGLFGPNDSFNCTLGTQRYGEMMTTVTTTTTISSNP